MACYTVTASCWLSREAYLADFLSLWCIQAGYRFPYPVIYLFAVLTTFTRRSKGGEILWKIARLCGRHSRLEAERDIIQVEKSGGKDEFSAVNHPNLPYLPTVRSAIRAFRPPLHDTTTPRHVATTEPQLLLGALIGSWSADACITSWNCKSMNNASCKADFRVGRPLDCASCLPSKGTLLSCTKV